MHRILAVAAGATLAFASGAAAEPEVVLPETLAAPSSPEVVAAQQDYYRRMTVPVTIEGKGPYQFMIDTGAQATVLTRKVSDQLQLKPLGRATVVGMASRESVDMVELDGLEFAARVFDGLNVPLLEAQHIGADGILGLDSLQDLRVLIDFRTQEIAVDDADNLGGNRGYEIVVRARNKLGRLIITNAEVDGVKTAVIIDTGAQGSMGNLALQRKLRAKHRDTVTTTDVNGGKITGQLDFARALVIDHLQLNYIPIMYADGPAFAALGLDKKPALILGMEDLRLFDRVAIDFSSRRVLFDLPTSATKPDGFHREFFPTRLKS
jgi:predicted aspartyl protease